MSTGGPFQEYSKDRLPSGLSYVVGRDRIAQSLTEAAAAIGHLSLGIADVDTRKTQFLLFDVYWKGDGSSRVFEQEPPLDRDRLLMRWHAVPSEWRALVAEEVADHWLPEACEWAAAATSRGNVWRAVDHRWMLWMNGTNLRQEIN